MNPNTGSPKPLDPEPKPTHTAPCVVEALRLQTKGFDGDRAWV